MSSSEVARQRASMPAGTSRILNARSLVTAHRRLAEILQPGQMVLDVGCGTGAITGNIAEAVMPEGFVVGVDITPHLLPQAWQIHRNIPNVRFVVGDIYHLPFARAFDMVSAARVLQWLAAPQQALQAMRAVTRARGRIVVLDYNHEKIKWTPAPPASMQQFYTAFLQWRAEAGMDNVIADHLAAMLRHTGLVDIRVTPQHEVSTRHDADFATRIGIWAEVAATRGHQMVADGFITATQRATTEAEYRAWMQTEAEAQSLYLLAVEGTVT
jgi:ubiquinone/menaquinone biosynthesis C-methylase UbiE